MRRSQLSSSPSSDISSHRCVARLFLVSSKMPTSLFSEMERGTNGGAPSLEDQRALQLALELSMIGLESSSGCPSNGNGTTNDPDSLQTAPTVFEESRSKKSQNMTECVPVPSSEHVAEIVGRQGEYFYRCCKLFFLTCLFFSFHLRIDYRNSRCKARAFENLVRSFLKNKQTRCCLECL